MILAVRITTHRGVSALVYGVSNTIDQREFIPDSLLFVDFFYYNPNPLSRCIPGYAND